MTTNKTSQATCKKCKMGFTVALGAEECPECEGELVFSPSQTKIEKLLGEKPKRVPLTPEEKEYHKNYRRSFRGTYKCLYSSLHARCQGKIGFERYKGFNHCSREEFENFARDSKQFKMVWEKWVKSGFEQKLAPSVDRIDNNRGYDLDNIQFLSRSDNTSKYLYEDLPDDGKRGVSQHKKKWRADTLINGDYHLIGLFETRRDAAVAHRFFRGFFQDLKDQKELVRTLQAENKSMREYIHGRTEIVKGSPFDPEAERIYRSLSSQ